MIKTYLLLCMCLFLVLAGCTRGTWNSSVKVDRPDKVDVQPAFHPTDQKLPVVDITEGHGFRRVVETEQEKSYREYVKWSKMPLSSLQRIPFLYLARCH